MTTFDIGRWLFVTLAILALAIAAPSVAAHGNDSAPGGTSSDDGTAADWASWMEDHMTDHMGPGSVAWMESHMGTTVDEMAADMADADHRPGTHAGQSHGTTSGGHGC